MKEPASPKQREFLRNPGISGFIQSDSWGGTLSAAATPDNLFQITPLPPALAGMQGSNDPNIIPDYFKINTPASA